MQVTEYVKDGLKQSAVDSSHAIHEFESNATHLLQEAFATPDGSFMDDMDPRFVQSNYHLWRLTLSTHSLMSSCHTAYKQVLTHVHMLVVSNQVNILLYRVVFANNLQAQEAQNHQNKHRAVFPPAVVEEINRLLHLHAQGRLTVSTLSSELRAVNIAHVVALVWETLPVLVLHTSCLRSNNGLCMQDQEKQQASHNTGLNMMQLENAINNRKRQDRKKHTHKQMVT